MGLRAETIPEQLATSPAINSFIFFGADGRPTFRGAFLPATSQAVGGFGLVPPPAIGQQGALNYFLRADGIWAIPPGTGGGGGGSSGPVKWDGSGGGGSGGNLSGGVANRLTFWSSATAVTQDDSLTFDPTNNILKASTINLSRNGLPGGGISDGDFQYDSATGDFRGRIQGQWINFTKQDEIILASNVTSYTVLPEHRNAQVVFLANADVTVNLVGTVDTKYGIVLVKRGTGNITVTTGVTNTYLGTSNQILQQNAAAYFYHAGSNNWRGYGTLGAAGNGTVTSVTLGGIAGLFTVTNPTINLSGTMQPVLNVQAASTFFRGPAVGAAAAAPVFGAIAVGDLPRLSIKAIGVTTDYTVDPINDFGRVLDISAGGSNTIRIPTTCPEGWYCSVWRGATAGPVTFSSTGGTLEAEATALQTQKTMAAIIVFPGNRHIVAGKLS